MFLNTKKAKKENKSNNKFQRYFPLPKEMCLYGQISNKGLFFDSHWNCIWTIASQGRLPPG